MNKKLVKDSLIWGFVLWLIGYILGFIFFAFVPQNLIGLFVSPIGIIITTLVLFKKINYEKLKDYFILGLIWSLMAIILDYLFIVKLLNPADGYYKPDVYFYYLITLTLPPIAGLLKARIKCHATR